MQKDLKERVIEALCNDTDFLMDMFWDIVDEWDLDVSDYFDEDGNCLDPKGAVEFIIDSTGADIEKLAEQYDVLDEPEIPYGQVMENVIRRLLKEDKEWSSEVPEDTDEYNAKEELDYDMAEFMKAMQKSNGTYEATSNDGEFKTGDKVLVHTKKGDIVGVIVDFGSNLMTYEETADVDYEKDGRTWTLVGCPLSRIETLK